MPKLKNISGRVVCIQTRPTAYYLKRGDVLEAGEWAFGDPEIERCVRKGLIEFVKDHPKAGRSSEPKKPEPKPSAPAEPSGEDRVKTEKKPDRAAAGKKESKKSSKKKDEGGKG